MWHVWQGSTSEFWWQGCVPWFCPRRRSAGWKNAQWIYIVFPHLSKLGRMQSCENRQKECTGVAPVITFACSNFAGQDSRSILVKNYVHGYEHILLGSLKSRLPINHDNLPKLLEITFKVILQGRQQHNQWYTKDPTILKFLAETSSDNHNAVGHQQMALGGLLQVEQACQGSQS